MLSETKVCYQCRTDKLLDSFHKHPLAKDGRFKICKECGLDNQRENRKSSLDAARLKYEYGLTPSQVCEQISIQGNKCPICDKDFVDRWTTVIDHCHITGRFRGVLCRRCNAGLGLLGDTLERVLKAAEYLRCL